MAGRDAYLALGFDQAGDMPKPPENGDTNGIINETSYSGERRHYAPHVNRTVASEETVQKTDFFAGLVLIICILLIGVFAGFFGRGAIIPASGVNAKPVLLGAEPALEQISLESGARGDLVRFGTDQSDRLVALAHGQNGNALILVETLAGDDVARRWLTAANGTGAAQIAPAKKLGRDGVEVVSLGEEGFVTTALADDTLTISRVQAGKTVWSKNYPTLAGEGSEISLAKSAEGVLVLAPSEDSGFIRMASINADGFVAWESTFERPLGLIGTNVTVDVDSQIYVALTVSDASEAGSAQSLVQFDERGRLVNENVLPLYADDVILNAVPSAYGGVFVLVTGSMPRLEQIGSTGEAVATISLPHMQFQDDAQLLALASGELVISSTLPILDDRVQVLLEQRSQDGVLIGQRAITIPADATVDSIVPVSRGEFLISGSIRQDRYAPTDLYLQRIGFSPETHPVTWTEPEATIVSAAVAPVETIETSAMLTSSREAATQLATSDTLDTPIIASLSIADSRETAVETVSDMSTSEAIDIAETEELETASLVSELETPVSVDAPQSPTPADPAVAEDQTAAIAQSESLEPIGGLETDAIDLNAAALSRFLGQEFTTLCRFTCIEAASGNRYPMTGTYLTSQLTSAAQRRAVHARICQSAALAPTLETQPVCGLN